MFRGALDEARYEPRALTAEEVAASYRPVGATHDVPAPWTADFPLWDETRKLAEAKDLPVLDGVEFHVIKKWDQAADGYTFLHGVGLAWHKGKLYASFGHNKGAENTVTEEAHYRVSEDGGQTWGELRVIDAGEEENLARQPRCVSFARGHALGLSRSLLRQDAAHPHPGLLAR